MDIKKHWIPVLLFAFLASCDEASNGPIDCAVPQRICAVQQVNYTEVPNLSFEDWNYVSDGYHQPTPGSFWATPNEAKAYFEGGVVVEQASGDHAMNGEGYAAKLITRRNIGALGSATPFTAGAIVSGKFATDLSDPTRSIRFGRAFNRRISSLRGFYKYQPVGLDACGMYVVMRTCNIVEDVCGNTYGVIDTIAMDFFRTTNTVQEYTEFELELEYEAGVYPDEVIIYFTSSYGALDGAGSEGSTLYLDQLSVEYE